MVDKETWILVATSLCPVDSLLSERSMTACLSGALSGPRAGTFITCCLLYPYDPFPHFSSFFLECRKLEYFAIALDFLHFGSGGIYATELSSSIFDNVNTEYVHVSIVNASFRN